MYERNPAPMSADAAVMANYFDTMRQFLETQGQVMAAYMGQAPQAGIARPMTRVAAPRMVASAAPSMQVMAPTAPMPAPAAAIELPAAVAPPQAAAAAPHVNGVDNPLADKATVAKTNGVAKANGIDKPAEAGAGPELNRDALADLLLGIIEEKTGYPRDMVGLDQGLEADLGIDSIKRIEVVGATLQALPEPMREALTASRSKLNTQATLNGMLDILMEAVPGAKPVAATAAVANLHAVGSDERRRA